MRTEVEENLKKTLRPSSWLQQIKWPAEAGRDFIGSHQEERRGNED